MKYTTHYLYKILKIGEHPIGCDDLTVVDFKCPTKNQNILIHIYRDNINLPYLNNDVKEYCGALLYNLYVKNSYLYADIVPKTDSMKELLNDKKYCIVIRVKKSDAIVDNGDVTINSISEFILKTKPPFKSARRVLIYNKK